MAKKSLKDAAQAGTSVFDTIAAGTPRTLEVELQTVPATPRVLYVQETQDAQPTQDRPARGRPKKLDGPELVRLNLRIPLEIKEYLQEAAYLASSPKKIVSLTEYLCDLVRKDKEQREADK